MAVDDTLETAIKVERELINFEAQQEKRDCFYRKDRASICRIHEGKVGNGWAVGWVAFVGNVAYPQLPTALCGDDSCADLLVDTQAVVNKGVWIGALGSWAAFRGLIIVSVLARLRPALRP